jgi:hypothetical protein
VNLKKGEETVGAFGYEEVLDRLREELDKLIAVRTRDAGVSSEAGAGGKTKAGSTPR